MYNNNLKKQLHGCLFLLCAMALSGTSCVDKDYDLSKDIDMTVGLGTEGLSVKLGNSDKIYLKDILDESDNTKTDVESSYYLIEEGNFDTKFDVKSVSSDINDIEVQAGEVIDYTYIKGLVEAQLPLGAPALTDVFTVPSGLDAEGKGDGGDKYFQLNIKDVDVAIKKISEIYPTSGRKVSLRVNLVQTGELAFALKTIKSLNIELPKFLPVAKNDIITDYPFTLTQEDNEGAKLTFSNVSADNAGNPIDLSKPFVAIRVNMFVLGDDGTVENAAIHLPETSCKVHVDGEFAFTTNTSFSMNTGDNISLSANVGFLDEMDRPNSTIVIDKVKGIFNPVIDPVIDPVDIASSLPDFLQDDDVVLDVANPTLKITADLAGGEGAKAVPFDIIFSGNLTAQKANEENRMVNIPESKLLKEKFNYLYFSQQEEPYDPDGLTEGYVKATISNFNELLKPSIPDQIQIDMSNGKIHLDQSAEQMVTLNSSYAPKMDYKIMVPFLFNRDLHIVYRDTTESIGDDLVDLAAKGVRATTMVHTTIPMKLHITAEVLDANDNLIDLQTEPVADVPSCKSGDEEKYPIELEVNLVNPSDLSKVDYIRFIVHAKASENPGPAILKSNQYLMMKDIRVKLNGQVIVDLN